MALLMLCGASYVMAGLSLRVFLWSLWSGTLALVFWIFVLAGTSRQPRPIHTHTHTHTPSTVTDVSLDGQAPTCCCARARPTDSAMPFCWASALCSFASSTPSFWSMKCQACPRRCPTASRLRASPSPPDHPHLNDGGRERRLTDRMPGRRCQAFLCTGGFVSWARRGGGMIALAVSQFFLKFVCCGWRLCVWYVRVCVRVYGCLYACRYATVCLSA